MHSLRLFTRNPHAMRPLSFSLLAGDRVSCSTTQNKCLPREMWLRAKEITKLSVGGQALTCLASQGWPLALAYSPMSSDFKIWRVQNTKSLDSLASRPKFTGTRFRRNLAFPFIFAQQKLTCQTLHSDQLSVAFGLDCGQHLDSGQWRATRSLIGLTRQNGQSESA